MAASEPQRTAALAGTRARLQLWRAVEAQHVASTMKLADGEQEQALLEDILEQSKPALPTAVQGLPYLLGTPFRYPPRHGSRFRGPGDPGVFYGAEAVRTACAELGYWRWRFLMDSDGLRSLGPGPQTIFSVAVDASAVDLRRPPHARQAAKWTHPSDYTATQSFARRARTNGIAMLRYQSVRDPGKGGCAALLDPAGFARPARVTTSQTWYLAITREHSVWTRTGEREPYDRNEPQRIQFDWA